MDVIREDMQIVDVKEEDDRERWTRMIHCGDS